MSNSGALVYFDKFSKEQVKEINRKIKENIVQEEEEGMAAAETTKIGKFFHLPCEPLMELIHPWLYQCQHMTKEYFGYDIYWDFHIEGLNYNVYGPKGEYNWHIDANEENTPVDAKLTCLLNLSEEPYEGGEFKTIGIEEEIKFDSGMGLILHPLIAHKITPVTKGERITLTYWAIGPSWR